MAYKILIVDDSPLSRVMLREMLESLGHRVVGEADSGQGAIDGFLKLKPDVMTLDISLPDMDGIQVLRNIRLKMPRARVILVTGNDQKKIHDQAEQLKAPQVAKPFTMQALSDALALAFGSPGKPL
ncbi:MAG: response regulator [Elusimicrobia bacterium]|nr:response regulator [Elusimicrobiota bacterium]